MTEWKEYKLGEICTKITSGGTPKTSEASYYDGNIPNNIIEEYEKYLNSILLGDIGKTNWQYNIEQGLFTYKNNKVRKLKANN